MAIKQIVSVQNEEIKQVVALHDTAERKKRGQFIAEGFKVCTSMIQQGIELDVLYTIQLNFEKAFALAGNRVVIVSYDVMKKMSTATTPSGLLGVFYIPSLPVSQELGKAIVLAQIQDPGNMGTIIRTAAALGITSIVVVEGTDPWGPKVIQASAGMLAHVTIVALTWEELKERAKDRVLAALVVKGGKPVKTLDKNAILVVGNEAKGLSNAWISQCNEQVTLPMPGGVESLNAAVAASIALYELHTQ